jgi:isopenicillin N synthase-like dioxygenase
VAIENVRSPQFRGYTRLGHEYTNGHADLRDQLDIGHELPAARLGPGDPAWLRLRGPNQWPDALPDLRPAVLAWMAALEAVGRTVLHGVALPSASPPTISTPRSDPTPRS